MRELSNQIARRAPGGSPCARSENLGPRHRVRRTGQRGAVLVEAAVVIPVFILLLGGMLFLHHVVREQQRVMMDAKNRVWQFAMASCTGDGNGVPLPSFTSTMPGAPGSDVSLNVNNSWGRGLASATSSVQVTDQGVFAFSQAVGSHMVVFCNNQTEPGSVRGVFAWLLAGLQGLGVW